MKRTLLILLISVLTWLAFSGGRLVAAPAPIPPPGRIPCEQDQTEDPNFNASRPYQASPCGDAPKANMCGNTLQIVEKTPTRTAPAGTTSLDVNITMPRKTYSATLTGAEFPIAGNTELTQNSQNPTDLINDATQVNEYLNWYLGGVNNRAEYGELKNTDQYIVNFSGPVQKLLPEAFQNSQRIISIFNLVTSQTYTEEASSNPVSAPGTTTDDAITHNQIVVCVEGGKPIPCYDGNGSPSKGKAYRLNDWYDGSLSPLTTFFNWLGTSVWNYRYPPLPWQFTENIYYQKAFNEWKGQTCIIVPIINMLVCGHLPIISNPSSWANLFKYVPLSNTVDKKAKNLITGVGINGQNGTELSLPPIAYEVVHEPILYFPHTAETSELSNVLNKTYIPQTGTTSVPPPLTTEPVNDPTTGICRILDLRTNEGDYLFPEVTPAINEVNVDVKEYTVTRIPCVDVTRTDPITGLETTVARCQGQITIEIRMITKVPYADEIYNSTTAGADSTFRRIFPKVAEGAPVSCVSNLPSVTDVEYIPKLNMDGMKVIDPLNRNTTTDSKLYFPHFGSVYDLFLKGIQTALRPQGFGEPIIDGKFCVNTAATGACKQWLFEKDPGGKFYYDKVIEVANSTTCNGKSLNPVWALGIALNENGGLMSDKVDGSSNSHWGCFVTQVGTIEEKLSCMARTLQRDCIEGKTDAQALIEYGYPPGYTVWPVTVLSPGAYPPPIFGSGFNVADILARLLSTNWFDAYKSKAPTFCPGSPVLTPPTP